MPFFLKPCVKFRRKKKARAMESCIKVCSDVTIEATDDDILQSHQSNSDTSTVNQIESSELNENDIVTTSLVHEDNVTDTSVNERLDQNLSLSNVSCEENNQFIITDDFSSESGVEDDQGAMSDARECMDGEDNQSKIRDVLSRGADAIIKDSNPHVSKHAISQDEQNPDRNGISVLECNKLNASKTKENPDFIPQNELNGNDSEKLLTAVKQSTETAQDIRRLKRIASIVNRVTVNSDIFEVIELIKAIECEESNPKQEEEKHRNLEENILEIEEIRSVLNEIIDKLDICDLNNNITETGIAPESYEACEKSLENENCNADLEVNIKNRVDQLTEVKLDGSSSERVSTKLENSKENSTSTLPDAFVSEKATIFEDRNVQNTTEITDLESKIEAMDETKKFLNFEEKNRFDEIVPCKISNELSSQVQSNRANEGSEKMHYVGDGIQGTRKIESQMCVEESTLNENLPHSTDFISNATTKRFLSEEFVCSKLIEMPFTIDERKKSDTDLNTSDEFLMKDETAELSVLCSEGQNEVLSENDFGYIKDDVVSHSSNEISSVNNNLSFSSLAGNCISNRNLLSMKPEMRQIETTFENNELTNNFVPFSLKENEDESHSKNGSNDDDKNVQLNHNVNSSSDFELSVENETPFDLSALPQCSFVQPMPIAMNVENIYDNIDEIKDRDLLKSAKDSISTTNLEEESLTWPTDIEDKYLSNSLDKFINMDAIVEQTGSKYKEQNTSFNNFFKTIYKKKSDADIQRLPINLNETILKPHNNENNERQKYKHITVHEKEEFNMTSNEKRIVFDENEINDPQTCNHENISLILTDDNECTSNVKLQNGVHASDIERVSEWSEHKTVPEMERDMDESTNIEKNERMISETDKSLSHSSKIFIKNFGFENFEEISTDEDILQYGSQAGSSIYSNKPKLDSQYDEMEILQNFDLNQDNTKRGRSDVDVDNKDSIGNCCNKSSYKCKKAISLPIYTQGNSCLENTFCHKLNYGTHIDTFPDSNTTRKEIITNIDNFLEKLKFQIFSNEEYLVNTYHDDENESKVIYTDSSDDSVNDEIYSEKCKPVFMEDSLFSGHGDSTKQNVLSYTEKTKRKNTHNAFDESNDSDLDIIDYLDDSVFNDRFSYCSTQHQDTDSKQEQNCCNFIDDEKQNIKKNSSENVQNCSSDNNNKSLNIVSGANPINNLENTINYQILGEKYDKPIHFKDHVDNNSELYENFEYLSSNSRYDHKSLNKYSVSSLSLSSESSKLSDSGDAKEVQTNTKESESFIISAAGDNKDGIEKVTQNDGYFQTYNKLQNSRKTLEIYKSESTKPCKVTTNRKNRNDSSQKKNIYPEKNENYSVDNDLQRIEMKQRENNEAFLKQKMDAMSVMGSNLRVIPIRRTEKLKFEFIDVDNKYKFHNAAKKEPNYLTHSENFSICETMPFYLQRKLGGHKMSIRTPTKQIKAIPKGDKAEEISEELTESENELFSSQASINMTPARKRILKDSRAIRSPKYPTKARQEASYILRKYPFLFRTGKLVAYITKDKNDGSYHIRKGFPVCDGDVNHYEHKIVDSKELHTTSEDNRKNQTSHIAANRAQSPDDLRLKFDDKFKLYAGKGRSNGELITYKRSTEWLRDAGLVGNLLTTEEANDAFKVTAGVKVALNRGDYRYFLHKLSRLKKLNYNSVYERLCSASTPSVYGLNEV